jgi:nucleoside-diphosphate-sugar epimerase
MTASDRRRYGKEEKSMPILITGGTGFIGSYIAKKLVEEGEDKVILMDVMPYPPAVDDIVERVEIVQGDFSEASQVMAVLKKHDISCVFHLGYLGGPELERSPSRAIRVNCEGTSNLFEMARIAGVQRVVWASSGAVFGRTLTGSNPKLLEEEAGTAPLFLYGACKLFNENIAEIYAQRHGFDHIALRVTSIYGLGRVGRRGLGGGPDIFSQLIEKAARGEPVIAPPADHRIYWSYVKDAAEALYCAYRAPKPKHRIFNFSGEIRTIADTILYLRSLFPQASIDVGTEPITILPYVKTNRIAEELGFEPSYSMEKGIKDYADRLLGRQA